MKEIYILNVSGGHGHFLQWILDKFCLSTPAIHKLPFSRHGASHENYKTSGKFIFIDDPDVENFLSTNHNKDVILITIDNEILYWERSCIYRAGGAGTDLFDEYSVANFLAKNGSNFPKFCSDNNMSIKEGYKFAFMDLENSGARTLDNKRKMYAGIENNSVEYFPISNFMNCEHLKNAIIRVADKFKFKLDLEDFDPMYEIWLEQNTILKTHDATRQFLAGKTSVKLDVLQQAYVDAQKK